MHKRAGEDESCSADKAIAACRNPATPALIYDRLSQTPYQIHPLPFPSAEMPTFEPIARLRIRTRDVVWFFTLNLRTQLMPLSSTLMFPALPLSRNIKKSG
ncbi:hypothetical protein R3I93_019347 [Phoxinus phoxinus]|uniref:Uncharacterized protein n=1 Tax=Phoxinus phoxinus TaxID=58324 RepID=A0AAN9CA28_9TELE